MPALERAPAKLTRSLRVLGRRNDGYHLLEAEMVSLDLADELEISEGDGIEVIDDVAWTQAPRASRPQPVASIVPSGPDNLVGAALAALGRRAHVRLAKRIPPGAGLGGGSSDAAAVLRWAGCRDLALAAALGSDVPFCVTGGRALVTGIGESLQPLPFVGGTYILVTPPFGVSTRRVYEAYDELSRSAAPSRAGPGGSSSGAAGAAAAALGKPSARNDLETAALAVEPRLAWWRSLLGEVAGRSPQLAGSGATWFIEAIAGEVDADVLRDALGAAVRENGSRCSLSVCRATPAVGMSPREDASPSGLASCG